MTPFERLVRQRPDPAALWKYKRKLERPLEITFDPRMGLTEPGEVNWDLGPELSRHGTYVKYAATYHSIHEGSFSVVLHIREGVPEPDDDPEGGCELGAILSSHEWYEFGTDLVTLRDSGFRMSWAAAQWLYEAARGELVDLHHAGQKAHGNVAPRGIRFALFATPYDTYYEPYLPRHENGDVPPPLMFLHGGIPMASDAQRAAEVAILAQGIAALTSHPDPRVDRLLHDTDATDVLRDLLLERGQPVEMLLRDRVSMPSLALLPLAGEDDGAIDDELEALWHRVLELDPMIDTSRPEVFDLAGPDL